MFTPEQKIEHLKNLGFTGNLDEIYKLYSCRPFNTNDENYKKLVSFSKQLCDEYTKLFADTNNPDTSISEYAVNRRNEIIEILFPGHGSIYGFGEWSQVVIGLVDTDGFNMINVRTKFSPTSLVHLQEYVFVAPNVEFGNVQPIFNGNVQPSKIVVRDNTWLCAAVKIGENSIIGNRSVVALGAKVPPNNSFNSDRLILGDPAFEKKVITEGADIKKTHKKVLRTDDQMRFLIQNVRNLGIDGDLEQYIRMLNCEDHNCLEPVMNKLYTLTHQLCAEFNDPRTNLIRKKIISNILFPIQGNNLNIGNDLYVDILGATQFGENVTVGDRVNLAGNVYVGDNVLIGDDAILQSIGHKLYYKGRQLAFHEKGYPIEINTSSFIEVKDDINIAKGTKIVPAVTLDRDTSPDELIIK